MTDITVDNEVEDIEEPEEDTPAQTFEVVFNDGKTVKAYGYLAITPEMAVVGDSNGRFNFATHMINVHHIAVVPEMVNLSVVKN